MLCKLPTNTVCTPKKAGLEFYKGRKRAVACRREALQEKMIALAGLRDPTDSAISGVWEMKKAPVLFFFSP